ncbi:aromatic amino acid ammonia-lyase [Streptomyces sp. NPDC058001]|uniref:aromatic amino acid ammonia-lyase n=1 Tax=Streptomyces sp. NPDC058001 TaxID=3346300 RepID=UPI0036EA2DD0
MLTPTAGTPMAGPPTAGSVTSDPVTSDPVTVDTVTGARLDGRRLDVDTVARIAGGGPVPEIDPAALDAMEHTWRAARRMAAEGARVYGRSTGVGAHRGMTVQDRDGAGHDLRLLLSHAGGIGDPLPSRDVRAMMAVRVNQLLAAGSGLRPEYAVTLAGALRAGVRPEINEYGAVGTGDLTALAQTGLTLIGYREWHREGGEGPAGDGAVGAPAPLTLQQGEALALLSSNALTLGQSALACHDLGVLLRASHTVTALSLLATGGSLEAYAAEVHRARPHPATLRAATHVRHLLGVPDGPLPPSARVQDPFGFRCFPQSHGPAMEAHATLERVLSIDLNSASENPLIGWDPDGRTPVAHHHGGFFATPLTLALDQLCLAVLGTARLSTARLSGLGRPELTGLRSYLADEASASSGMMILEYGAAAAVAEIHACATPATLGHVVLSHGVEEAASFATQAARKALRAADAYRLVLACELVTAVRALRQLGTPPSPTTPAGRAYALASATLNPDMTDRPLTDDITRATSLLTDLPTLPD